MSEALRFHIEATGSCPAVGFFPHYFHFVLFISSNLFTDFLSAVSSLQAT